MWFRKKMPDAVLRRMKTPSGRFLFEDLINTYERNGHRWCDFRGKTLLLRADGTVVGDLDCQEWGFL